jgi:hypothetical protein
VIFPHSNISGINRSWRFKACLITQNTFNHPKYVQYVHLEFSLRFAWLHILQNKTASALELQRNPLRPPTAGECQAAFGSYADRADTNPHLQLNGERLVNFGHPSRRSRLRDQFFMPVTFLKKTPHAQAKTCSCEAPSRGYYF